MRIPVLIFTVLAILSLPACAPSPAPAPAPPASSPVPAAVTFAQSAGLGKNVYAAHCGSCHGTNGEGGKAPAIIGARANLSRYNTVRGLLDYVGTVMPSNAPGTLTPQDYQNVVAYLLVQDGLVAPGTVMDAVNLGGIALKK